MPRATEERAGESVRLHEAQAVFLEELFPGEVPEPFQPRSRFVRPPKGTIEDRFRVYRNAYVVRLAGSIENDFPALARILGRAALLSLVARYLATFPPRSFDIGRAGDRLGSFLEDDALRLSLPFLADLARFEWALAEARTAAAATLLAWADLASLGPGRVAELPLRLAPGARLVRSAWPLEDTWRTQSKSGAEIDVPLENGPTSLLVWRAGLDPTFRALDRAEVAIVECAERGESLASRISAAEVSTEALVLALRHLTNDGAFAAELPRGDASGAPSRKEIA
jgi:hypothetical protein